MRKRPVKLHGLNTQAAPTNSSIPVLILNSKHCNALRMTSDTGNKYCVLGVPQKQNKNALSYVRLPKEATLSSAPW